MCPGISLICGVATRACLAIHYHVGSSRHYLLLSVQLIFVDCYLRWIIALVTIFAVFLLSWALWITALVAYFANSVPSPSHPSYCRKWPMVGVGPGKFLHWNSFSMRVLVGGCLQGLFLLTELPWNLLAVPGNFAGAPPTFDGTSSQTCLLYTSDAADE